MSKSIVWLHLSDLHYCATKTGWDAHRVLDPLLSDLREMENQHGLLPQLVFFTGDAAFGNYGSGPGAMPAEQYHGAEEVLTHIRQAFSVEIPKENLFLVPGNHDVDRGEATEALTDWIEKQNKADAITNLIQSKNKQWLQFMGRLQLYRQFLQDRGYTHLLADPERLIYAETRQIHGVKLGIGGFNSAWNCGRDGEKGKLWLAADWQNGSIVRNLKAQHVDLNIALIHHPPGWFVEQEDAKLRNQMERDFDFFLHGHEHQGWVNAAADGHVRIAAAACYERADQENGYNFVRLNPESGEVEIWLRRYDDHGGGWIPRVIKNKTNNDGLWPIKIDSLAAKLVRISRNGLKDKEDFPDTSKPAVTNQTRMAVNEENRKSSDQPASESPKPASAQSNSVSQLRQRLKRSLTAQLAKPELGPIADSFAEKLCEHFQELSCNYDDIADFLVNGQCEGDNRRNPILLFLDVAEKYTKDEVCIEPMYDLFAYLLQTLVRQSGSNDKDLIDIPVKLRETVELINASRTVTPLVPDYAKKNLEFKNARRSSRLADLGDFQPPTGSWDHAAVCREMAKVVLKELGETDIDSIDPLWNLRGRLSRHDLNPAASKVQGIYIHQEQRPQHPLNVPEVAAMFRKETENKLPLFVFGSDAESAAQDWLHTEEEKIRGLVVQDNTLVESHGRINKIERQSESAQSQTKEASNMNSSINLSNIGSNTTVNINTGQQTDAQVGQGNVRLSVTETAELRNLLTQLRNNADKAPDIGKQEYVLIDRTTQDIDAELQKAEGVGKSALAKAKDVLDGFKDAAGIAESIEKITRLLLPLIS
jgi:hypothetical protein